MSEAHERAMKTEARALGAHLLNLRNREIAPEKGFRLIDILGAPMGAGEKRPVMTQGKPGFAWHPQP
jgi:hypothetical protein